MFRLIFRFIHFLKDGKIMENTTYVNYDGLFESSSSVRCVSCKHEFKFQLRQAHRRKRKEFFSVYA